MDRRTRFREAVKAALALALVYGIALKAGWMNPYWAGLAVALIALPTAGQSIQKGVLRLAGTIPGCLAAMAIIGLAPQNRWNFILLTAAWVAFTTYMMLADKQRSYLWNVAGLVCLAITVSGPSSSEAVFSHAMYRTTETAMGIVVYTLVTVFLWPRTNAGAIKKTSAALVATQAELCQAGHDVMARRDTESKLPALHTQEMQQLGQLVQALQAEGSENYEVHELRPAWERFHGVSTELMQALARWHAGLTELAHIDVNAALPGLPGFFDGLDRRFQEIQRTLAGQPAGGESLATPLSFDAKVFQGLPLLDRSILAVLRRELGSLEVLTGSMLECAHELADGAAGARTPPTLSGPGARGSGWKLPVPDLDHLRGAAFTVATLFAGFLIWIGFDPPGHAGWFEFPAILAMAVAQVQQLKMTLFLKPLAVAGAMGLGAYVFIMPQLSSFLGLGLLLFLCMFVVSYFFSGIARLAGIIAIIMEISVQNPQTYSFAAMANSYVYLLMTFTFVFVMSYLIQSPRPEKAALSVMRRFFGSAGFLISQMAREPGRRRSILARWKTAFHLHEVRTLPAKLGGWGKAIDRKKFPDNSPENLQALVTTMQALVCRIEQLQSVGGANQAQVVARDLSDDLETWRSWIQKALVRWSKLPEAQPVGTQRQDVKSWFAALEQKVAQTIREAKDGITEEEGESFYRLIGGYRGVSHAALAYAGAASSIDWAHWREERF